MEGMNIFEVIDESTIIDDEYQVAPIEEENIDKDDIADEPVIDDKDKDTEEENKEDDYLVAPADDKDLEKSSDPESKHTDKDNSSNTISSFIKALVEEDILSLEEGREIKTLEEAYDAIQEDKERYLKDQLDAFPEASYKEAFEAVKAGVPIEQVLGYQTNVEKYNSITEETLEDESEKGLAIRKQVLTDSYVSKGFSQAKAAKLIQRAIDAGEDVQDAKDAIVDLKVGEKASFDKVIEDNKQAVKDAEKARQESLKSFETYLKDTDEIIPGRKLTVKYKKELYDSMTKGVGSIDGKPVDPVNKFLIEGGQAARAFLTDVILATNYGKNKDVISTVKARNKATEVLKKQLTTTSSSNFAQENSTFSEDDLWNNVPSVR